MASTGRYPLDITYASSNGGSLQYSLVDLEYIAGNYSKSTVFVNVGGMSQAWGASTPLGVDTLNYNTKTRYNPVDGSQITEPDASVWHQSLGYNAAFGCITQFIDSVFNQMSSDASEERWTFVLQEFLANFQNVLIFPGNFSGGEGALRLVSALDEHKRFQELFRDYLVIKYLNQHTNNRFFINYKIHKKTSGIFMYIADSSKDSEKQIDLLEEKGIRVKKHDRYMYEFEKIEDANLALLTVDIKKARIYDVAEYVKPLRNVGLI
jgi:hypothetical protein